MKRVAQGHSTREPRNGVQFNLLISTSWVGGGGECREMNSSKTRAAMEDRGNIPENGGLEHKRRLEVTTGRGLRTVWKPSKTRGLKSTNTTLRDPTPAMYEALG